MAELKIVGLKDLLTHEQDDAKDFINQNFEKLKTYFGDDITAIVQVHTYENDGGRCKYSIHLKVEWKTKMFNSDKTADFNLQTAIKDAFSAIETQIKHTQDKS